MVEALLDGTADCIATDHAPHAAFEKRQEFERAPNGITGLETALGVALRLLHRGHGMKLSKIVELMSTAPAAITSLAGRGALGQGHYADLVLFDAGDGVDFRCEVVAIEVAEIHPFDGAAMLGQVRYTICEGRVVYRA